MAMESMQSSASAQRSASGMGGACREMQPTTQAAMPSEDRLKLRLARKAESARAARQRHKASVSVLESSLRELKVKCYEAQEKRDAELRTSYMQLVDSVQEALPTEQAAQLHEWLAAAPPRPAVKTSPEVSPSSAQTAESSFTPPEFVLCSMAQRLKRNREGGPLLAALQGVPYPVPSRKAQHVANSPPALLEHGCSMLGRVPLLQLDDQVGGNLQADRARQHFAPSLSSPRSMICAEEELRCAMGIIELHGPSPTLGPTPFASAAM